MNYESPATGTRALDHAGLRAAMSGKRDRSYGVHTADEDRLKNESRLLLDAVSRMFGSNERFQRRMRDHMTALLDDLGNRNPLEDP